MKTQLLIIGAGAAGISAACAAWDGGCRDVLLVDKNDIPGGVLPQCTHAGFGLATYGRELTGPEYARHILQKLNQTGVSLRLNTTVTAIFPDKTALLFTNGSAESVRFDSLILATGCRELNIGSLLIPGTRPEGIFTAGQAQELMNLRGVDVGREILVMGSGDLGLIMARRFAEAGKHVVAVVEKNAHYGGMARNYRRCIEAYHIPLLCSTEVTEIFGEPRLTGVTVRRNGADSFVPCDTLITAIGMLPEQTLVRSLGSPDWFRCCGNCHRIHDLIDSAVCEATNIGKDFCHDR